MALQKILKQSYIDTIFDEIDKGVGLDRFLQDQFPVEEKYLLVIPNIKQPEGLCDMMNPSKDADFQSAKALFEAYKNLQPLQAMSSQLWDSLALTDLFPYMQKRWNLKDCKDIRKEIKNHFMVHTHGITRQGLSSLWWLAYQSYDEGRANPYELTEVLFKNYTMRYVRFGVGKVIQHKEAAIGLLQYLKDNMDKIPSLENVTHGLTSHFNKLGAVKQLTYLNRDFFYNEMAEHFEEFKTATSHYDKDEEEE